MEKLNSYLYTVERSFEKEGKTITYKATYLRLGGYNFPIEFPFDKKLALYLLEKETSNDEEE